MGATVIIDKSFSREWIQEKRKAYKGVDPGLIEKQIYVFELLHHLAKSGKEFVFKGGTSLHLICLTIDAFPPISMSLVLFPWMSSQTSLRSHDLYESKKISAREGPFRKGISSFFILLQSIAEKAMFSWILWN